MNVDKDLKCSCEQIKKNLINDITQITRNAAILDMEPFPDPLDLAKLAKAVYTDGFVNLPEGWKYLTTAFNKSWGNGYYGAAYWKPSLQQVVIAHRGTQLTNEGALRTNYNSVVGAEYSSQMDSAVTFSDLIMTLLGEVNGEKGVSLQLSLTGHSLGGWLAQVTAFTLKHTQRGGDGFIKRHEHSHARHVHTVTFDTPGCGDMLKKIIDDGYNRYRGTVSPDRLDITNFLAPPNRINTTGSHVGTIKAVTLDVSKFGRMEKHTPWYNKAVHGIDNFVKAFEDKATIREVLDWPLSSGALGGVEFSELFRTASQATNFIPDSPEEEQQQNSWIKELRYKTEEVESSRNLRVFSEKELYLLQLWSALKAEKVKLNRISNFVKRHKLGTIEGLFVDFQIDLEKRTVTCQSEESLRALIGRSKQLMRWFHPEFPEAVERQSAQVPRAGPLIYQMAARNYLESLPECQMDFEDTIELAIFLESSETRILHIKTEDSRFQAAVLCRLLSQMRKMTQFEHMDTYLRHERQTIVNLETLLDLDRTVDFDSLYESEITCDDLLVVDSASSVDPSSDLDIFERFLYNVNKKLIIISSVRADYERFLESLNVPFATAPRAQLGLGDLTEDSQREFFSRKMLIIGGKEAALKDYTNIQNVSKLLSHIDGYIDRQTFKEIVTDRTFTVKIEAALLGQDDLKVHSTVNKEVSVARVARALREHSGGAALVISGIAPEELRTDPWRELAQTLGEERIFATEGNGEAIFRNMCREEPGATVYWLAASAGLVHCKSIYETGFYMKRRFHKIFFNIQKFVRQAHRERDLFVFQNVGDERSLMSHVTISEENTNIFFNTEHVKMAASSDEADDIIKENPDRAVHILEQETNGGLVVWRRSRGILEDLLPYVSTDVGESIDEGELRNTSQKVVIIADEPGMGKSTSLTSVSRLLRPSAWVIRVDLKDFQIPNFQILRRELTLNSVCELILRDEHSWSRGLLQFCLDKKNKNSRSIYVCFDGFDEIKRDSSTEYSAEDRVLKLLEFLNNETTARVWVTTRHYRREMLENALSVVAMQFERISERHQREYLVKFWRPHLLLELDRYKDAEKEKLERCAEYVFQNAKRVLGDDVHSFMGIPLQMRMLAEVSMRRVRLYVETESDIENIFDVKSVLDLYQQFISLKYDIYFGDKTGLDIGLSEKMKSSNKKKLTEKHRLLALRTLFPEFAKEHFGDLKAGWGDELCRVGLVQAGGGGAKSVEFIHRTLAEYFCSDLAVRWLRKRGRYHGHAPVAELLLTKILLRDSHKVIGIFMNNLVLLLPLSEDADEYFALKISELWCSNVKQQSLFDHQRGTALHRALWEQNTGVISILVGGLRCARAQKELIPFLAAHEKWCYTALGQIAQEAGDDRISETVRHTNAEIMMKFVQSFETCPHEVILELLLATYIRYADVFDDDIKCLSEYVGGEAAGPAVNAAFSRTREIIHAHIPRLRAAVEESVSINIINDISGRSTAGRTKRVKKLYGAMENDTERLYTLLATGGGEGGETVLHRAARGGDTEEQSEILAQIVRILCYQNIPEAGRSYDKDGCTPLHRAAAAGQLEIVEHLINRGVHCDSLTRKGETVLSHAARAGRLPVVEYLIEKGSDVTIVNDKNKTALDMATEHDHRPVMEYLQQKMPPRAE